MMNSTDQMGLLLFVNRYKLFLHRSNRHSRENGMFVFFNFIVNLISLNTLKCVLTTYSQNTEGFQSVFPFFTWLI